MTTSLIRPARSSDAPRILQLVRALALYEKEPDSAVVTLAQIERSLFGSPPHAWCHVAEEGGQVVGFAVWHLNYSTWLGKPGMHLEDLFVEPSSRGQGHGLALLKALASICVERDYGRFQWMVLDWNEPSIQFYRSLGAVPLDEWTMFRVTGEALTKLGA